MPSRRLALASLVAVLFALSGAAAAPSRGVESTRLSASFAWQAGDQRSPRFHRVRRATAQAISRSRGTASRVVAPLRSPSHREATHPEFSHALFQRPPPVLPGRTEAASLHSLP